MQKISNNIWQKFSNCEGARISPKAALFASGFSAFALLIGVGLTSTPATGQAKKAKGVQQRVVAAPVNYWMDLSNGGRSMMPNMPFGLGGASNNTFGDAYHGAAGRHADIAISHKDFPRAINANQAIPSGLRLGRSLALIPNQVTPSEPRERRESPDEAPKPPEGNFKMSFYWGCGANVRAGQPKVIEIRNGQIAAYNAAMQGRSERDRGAGQVETASRWPNARDKRAIENNASLVGAHTLSGANIPASMAYNIDNAHDFMGDLGLSSSGDKSQNLTFSWNNISAKAYFLNAFGMSGNGENTMEMVIWSSADVPDPGHGLMNYLSMSNITRWLQERALLPANQTSCVVPRGIFASSQMVMARGIGYGDETNLVYPARPTDPNIPWIQEWTARIRNKSMATLLVGMPSMGDMMSGRDAEDETPNRGANNSNNSNNNNYSEEQRQRDCERAAQTGQNTGTSVGQDAGYATGGDWRAAAAGRALGGLLGRGAAKKANANCQSPPRGN